MKISSYVTEPEPTIPQGTHKRVQPFVTAGEVLYWYMNHKNALVTCRMPDKSHACVSHSDGTHIAVPGALLGAF